MLFSQEFLIVLESPSSLLGRDILNMVQASVFTNMEPALLIEQNVNPRVSGPRVLIKRGPGNRGPTECGTTHEATSGMSS